MGDADQGAELVRPRTERELAAFVRDRFGLQVPGEGLIPGHSGPLEYLAHAFFEDAEPRDCVVWANRGEGKTFLAAVATVLDLVFKPGIEVRVLGGSLDQAKRMHTHLRESFSREPLDALVDGRITERRLRLRNGPGVELLAQSQTSVRGTRVQKLRCDEVELFDPDVWEAAQLVTRERQCGEVFVPGSIECLSTMHVPYGIMHRLIKEATGGAELAHEDAQGEPVVARRSMFRWGVLDVLGECGSEHACARCALHPECAGRAKATGRTPGHVSVREAVRLKRRVGRAAWDCEMLCLRPTRSDCVLPEFHPARHVVDELAENLDGWSWVCGVDFGFRAPTAVLFAGVDPRGTVWVVDERVVAGAVLDRHIDAIEEGPPALTRWSGADWVGVDPAGRQRSGQTGLSDIARMRARGLTVRDRTLGVADGLGLVRARLAPAAGSGTDVDGDVPEPRLVVHRRCERLIESLESYHYPRDRPESLEPVKDGHDHAVDALRYLVQNLDRPYRTTRGGYL